MTAVADPGRLASRARRRSSQEVLDQQRDIARAVAKRRQRDHQDLQSVEQVLAEPARLDFLSQVAVGGR